MKNLYEYIGKKLRELRENYGGKGTSQDEVAQAVGTTANTVSRWESATYKPSAGDLHKLARFFGVSIAVFFPDMETPRLQALMSATGNLKDQELDELIEYARFRQARRILNDESKPRKR
jgi:transcriptional regulator with XRE-family HTH domain